MLMPLPFHAQSIAESIYQTLDQASMTRGFASLAIPGGRSPSAVLTHLASIMETHVRDRLHLFWVDERAVPVGHEDRNDLTTLAAWERGGALPAHVHSMPADRSDLEKAAQEYTETLTSVCKDHPLDVCLLGIGEDGHIASLFPDHESLNELDSVFAIYDSPKKPAQRLSLSLAVLNRCKHCHILALGEAKGHVYEAIRLHGQSKSYPVSLLHEEHCAWYLDEAALSVCNLNN